MAEKIPTLAEFIDDKINDFSQQAIDYAHYEKFWRQALQEAYELGHQEAAPLRKVLEEFVDDINRTDGLVRKDSHKGEFPAPAADPEWTDLAATYLHACTVLGVEPQWCDEED